MTAEIERLCIRVLGRMYNGEQIQTTERQGCQCCMSMKSSHTYSQNHGGGYEEAKMRYITSEL